MSANASSNEEISEDVSTYSDDIDADDSNHYVEGYTDYEGEEHETHI